MKCPECNGKGYKEEVFYQAGEYFGVRVISSEVKAVFKVWCESCEGKGEVSFDGDRTNWEGE